MAMPADNGSEDLELCKGNTIFLATEYQYWLPLAISHNHVSIPANAIRFSLSEPLVAEVQRTDSRSNAKPLATASLIPAANCMQLQSSTGCHQVQRK